MRVRVSSVGACDLPALSRALARARRDMGNPRAPTHWKAVARPVAAPPHALAPRSYLSPARFPFPPTAVCPRGHRGGAAEAQHTGDERQRRRRRRGRAASQHVPLTGTRGAAAAARWRRRRRRRRRNRMRCVGSWRGGSEHTGDCRAGGVHSGSRRAGEERGGGSPNGRPACNPQALRAPEPRPRIMLRPASAAWPQHLRCMGCAMHHAPLYEEPYDI